MHLHKHILSKKNYVGCFYFKFRTFASKPTIQQGVYISEENKRKKEKKDMIDNMGDEFLELKVKNVKSKLIFNSYIQFGLGIPNNYWTKKILVEKQYASDSLYQGIINDHTKPISLKYLEEHGDSCVSGSGSSLGYENNERESKSNENQMDHGKSSSETVFPYQIKSNYTDNSDIEENSGNDAFKEELDFYDKLEDPEVRHWMKDYEVYDDTLDDEHELDSSYFNYGTPDPSIPASTVPCGGCGAHLHCQDPSIPGYLPRELFYPCSLKDLQAIICQRCHLLKKYNLSLNVSVKPEDYPKLLAPLKERKALVILIVDMTDFPCSIWPEILHVIGKRRPIFVVGNKIDTIPGDCKRWLIQAEESLRDVLPSHANVKDVSFISARTGYGVEDLITKIFNIWQFRGDVYLVGCTNVGKSTLFNALLQSDMCKVKAADVIRRATTSPWPGTTLNLLKFPILRPSYRQMALRNIRLSKLSQLEKRERQLREEQAKVYKSIDTRIKSLVGHIGRTFTGAPISSDDSLSVDMLDPTRLVSRDSFNESDENYLKGRWCYDTPGTIQPDQIIHLLTTEELILTLPKSVINPQVFLLYPGQTLFIAGLGRLDYLESTNQLGAKFAVMASNKLPITVCKLENASEVYSSLLGTKAFAVPNGSYERLQMWPNLESKNITLVGREENTVCADVVLSSAGWIGINLSPNQEAKFQCWTPQGRGIYVRNVPLQKYIHKMKGKKYKQSPMYALLEGNMNFE